MTIQELLTEYAEGARTYNVGGRALQIGRRQRMMTRAVPVAAALAVVVAGGTVALAVHPGATALMPPATNPATAWNADLLKPSDFPARIEPDRNAPALPTNAGVGRGVWVYADAPGTDAPGPYFLVTAGGRQYRLDGSGWLSPQGRWLVMGQKLTPITLRDLTSDTSLTIPSGNLVWSSNERWVATFSTPIPGDSPADRVVQVADLADPGARPTSFTVPIGTAPLMITNEGDVVLSVPSTTAGVFDLVVRQRLTGAQARRVTVDYTANLTGEELQGVLWPAATGADMKVPGGWPVNVSDDRLLLQVLSMNPIRMGPVVSIDLATGASTRAFAVTGAEREAWQLERPLGDGSLLLLHYRDGRQVSLDRYDPVTRQRTQLTDLSAVSG